MENLNLALHKEIVSHYQNVTTVKADLYLYFYSKYNDINVDNSHPYHPDNVRKTLDKLFDAFTRHMLP